MSPLMRTVLNYGAMSGIGCFVIFLLLFFSGVNPLGNASWLAAWIPIVFICISTAHYREHEREGYITYGLAFKTGFLTAMASAFMYVLLIYIFGTFINSGLVDAYKADVIEQLEQTKSIVGESLYEKAMESLEHTTMFSIAFGDYFTKCIGGLLVSLITAAVYKKDPPVFRETME